ncbi:MAG: hypothetical protein HY650_15280 [Acidobacteria bacterium]|nr:hypothetical protein [Acidobacteriota bacterium]
MAALEIGADELHLVWLHRVHTGEGTPEPLNVEAASFEIRTGSVEQAHLGCPEPMTVRNEENRAVALVLDCREVAAQLLLGEELNDALRAARFLPIPRHAGSALMK